MLWSAFYFVIFRELNLKDTVKFKSSFSHPPVTTYQNDLLNWGSLSLPKSNKNSFFSLIINDNIFFIKDFSLSNFSNLLKLY